jgi:hypothetical protein
MDTSGSAVPEILASLAPRSRPVVRLSAGARLRRGLAGFRYAAVAAGTELTKGHRADPRPAPLPVPAGLIGISWACQRLMRRHSGEPLRERSRHDGHDGCATHM